MGTWNKTSLTKKEIANYMEKCKIKNVGIGEIKIKDRGK